MKVFKSISLASIILISWTLIGCSSNNTENNSIIIEDVSTNTNNVIEYNDSLVDFANTCIDSEDAIWIAYNDKNINITNVQNAINNTLEECDSSINKIEALWDWEWDNSLKDWITNILKKHTTYYSKFNELLPYIEKKEISEEENETYKSLITEVENLDKELAEANENLITLQKEFALNHWFELEIPETDEVINEETNEVIEQ